MSLHTRLNENINEKHVLRMQGKNDNKNKRSTTGIHSKHHSEHINMFTNMQFIIIF